MNLDVATVQSLAVGHRTMWPRHRTRPVCSAMGEVVGYLCDGVSDAEPCPVDWYIPVDREEQS